MKPWAAAAICSLARAAALAAALCLHAKAGMAEDGCASQVGAQLLRQQLLPSTPAHYLACNMPAASRDGRQIAVADDGDIVGPSSCQDHVCTFKSADGRGVTRWHLLTAPPGVTLDDHMARLAETLRADGFTPMTPLQPSAAPRGRGTVLTLAGFRVAYNDPPGSAWLVVHAKGHPPTRHRFPSRTMRCEAEPLLRTLPWDVRAWAQEGVPAVVVAAQYPGSERGCSWTEWIVVPFAAGSRH